MTVALTQHQMELTIIYIRLVVVVQVLLVEMVMFLLAMLGLVALVDYFPALLIMV